MASRTQLFNDFGNVYEFWISQFSDDDSFFSRIIAFNEIIKKSALFIVQKWMILNPITKVCVKWSWRKEKNWMPKTAYLAKHFSSGELKEKYLRYISTASLKAGLPALGCGQK